MPKDFFHMKKNKKPLIISLVIADVAITITLLVISIIMLSQTVGKSAAQIKAAKGFIGYLQNHPTIYLVTCVIPLFLILAANIISLVFYVKKVTKAEPIQMSELSDEQKNELKKQILADLQKQQETAAEKKDEGLADTANKTADPQ